nr:response regulator [Allomuricauda sp.]
MRQTICIIDDDLVSQFATRYCIQQYQDDFEIITCTSAEEGLVVCSELLENQKPLPDIIFLDLVMEEMDGWTFVDNLSQMAKNHHFPKIYVLSAFVNAKDRAIAREHKLISGYFDKPLSRNVLGKIFVKDGNNV